jgi:hypothetical protein
MIKQLCLQDALHERPSNSQLKRNSPGNWVKLSYNDNFFWVKLVFMRGDDMIGMAINNEGSWLKQGELLIFTAGQMHEIMPNEKLKKLNPFMLVTHFDSKEIFVLHTKQPRMIAEIEFGDQVTAIDAIWIDQPEDNETTQQLLKKIGDWYFYNYVKKK